MYRCIIFLVLCTLVCCVPKQATVVEHRNHTHVAEHSDKHIEVRDTFIIQARLPRDLHSAYGVSASACGSGEVAAGESGGEIVYHSHYERAYLTDTLYLSRTDTVLRTETVVHRERYVPRRYKWCACLVCLAFLGLVGFLVVRLGKLGIGGWRL